MATYIYGVGGTGYVIPATGSSTTSNDTYTLNGTATTYVTGTLNSDAGSDAITANYFKYSGILLGLGDDSITLTNSTYAAGTATFNLGDGTNTVNSSNSILGSIAGGVNNDNITITGGSATSIGLAGGDNSLTATNTSLGAITASAGHDTISFNNTTTTSAMSLGAGNNSLNITNGSSTSSIATGNGNDIINVTDSTTGVIAIGGGVNHVTLSNSTAINIQESTNTGGYNVINITNGSTLTGSINFSGASDGDTINVTDSKIQGTILIGSGDDNVLVKNSSIGGNGLNAGFGNDTITLNNATLTQTTMDLNSTNNVFGNAGNDTFRIISFAADDYWIHGGYGDDIDVLDLSGITHSYQIYVYGPNTVAGAITLPAAGNPYPTFQYTGYITYVDKNNVTHTIRFTEIESFIPGDPPCFTPGTRIETDLGNRVVEKLTVGQMVRTQDRGFQPIRWIGSTKVAATGKHAPIMIMKGALGNKRDLLVSPNHRMLISDWRAEVLFGKHEVLIAAKDLVNNDNIYIQRDGDKNGEVEYYHIMFDHHEIIFAEGIPTESFYAGSHILDAMEQDVQDEIYALFPELIENEENLVIPARSLLAQHEASVLLNLMLAS